MTHSLNVIWVRNKPLLWKPLRFCECLFLSPSSKNKLCGYLFHSITSKSRLIQLHTSFHFYPSSELKPLIRGRWNILILLCQPAHRISLNWPSLKEQYYISWVRKRFQHKYRLAGWQRSKRYLFSLQYPIQTIPVNHLLYFFFLHLLVSFFHWNSKLFVVIFL